MTSDDQFQAEMRHRYVSAQWAVSEGVPLALLHIGPEKSAVVTGHSGEDVRIVQFSLGYAGVPATLFSLGIPTALELENAIAAVEDEVMPLATRLDGLAELLTSDPEFDALYAASPDSPDRLSIQRVEWLFDELSRASRGRPASQLPFIPTKQISAIVLVMRELMHHCGIHAIHRLKAAARAPPDRREAG